MWFYYLHLLDLFDRNSSYIRLSKGGELILPPASIDNFVLSKWTFVDKPLFTIITHGSLANRFVNPSKEEKYYNLIVLKDFSELTHKSLLNMLLSTESADSKFVFAEECLEIGSFYQSFVSTYYNKLCSLDLRHLCLPFHYIYDILDRDTLLTRLGFNPQSLLSLTQS